MPALRALFILFFSFCPQYIWKLIRALAAALLDQLSFVVDDSILIPTDVAAILALFI